MTQPPRERFTLTLVDCGRSTPATQRLGLALKTLLRSFGLRVVECSENPATPQATPETTTTEGPCEG